MNYKIEYAWFCHGGNVRPNNEDNYWCMGDILPMEHVGDGVVRQGICCIEDRPIFGVFDGMGGESCGEVASYLGALTFGRLSREEASLAGSDPEGFLTMSCTQMNDAVLSYAKQNQIGCMGSTVAISAFGKEHIAVANLGDSRIYAWFDGKMAQISKDHVMGRSLFGKAPLTQYLGMPRDEQILEPHVVRLPYRNGLRIVLCSDGLSDMVSEKRIREFIGDMSAEEAGRSLLEEALQAGGRDNVTAVVIRILGMEDKRVSGKEQPKIGLLSRIFGRKP